MSVYMVRWTEDSDVYIKSTTIDLSQAILVSATSEEEAFELAKTRGKEDANPRDFKVNLIDDLTYDGNESKIVLDIFIKATRV